MKTRISRLFLDTVAELATDFANARVDMLQSRYSKKVFKAAYRAYFELSLYLYIKLNKISRNRRTFEYNHIHSLFLKQFSPGLYKKIIEDLEKHQIIKANNHYCHVAQKRPFTKSYVIHKQLLQRIDESKQKFQFESKEIEVPTRIKVLLSRKEIPADDDKVFTPAKMTRFNGTIPSKEHVQLQNFYSRLDYSEKDLDQFSLSDDIKYMFNYRLLKDLHKEPEYNKGRWYHVFHQFSKMFRQKVLRLDGERLKEIFDISASDLHMLAKTIEDKRQEYHIPMQELLDFQREVKQDKIRKTFGVTKSGKCRSDVKRAFKVWLNSKKELYGHFRYASICYRIDEWFKVHFPNIRKYIIANEKLWLTWMNKEFEVMSVGLVNRLKERGIDALTCHDAIYVKNSVEVADIREMFYQELGLLADDIDRMLEI